jgi:hypothetical protein
MLEGLRTSISPGGCFRTVNLPLFDSPSPSCFEGGCILGMMESGGQGARESFDQLKCIDVHQSQVS